MVDQVYGAGVVVRTVLAAALLGVTMMGCNGGTDEAACGKAFAEPIDPNSSIHILPGQPELPYRTNPPTSGAHRVTQIPTGPSLEAIPKPDQVHILESGRVLIQYKGLKPIKWAALNRLASDQVVVAPNNSLDTAVVATAWLFKMECTSVDVPALNDFVKAHAEKVSLH
jgi:hypothetical protein